MKGTSLKRKAFVLLYKFFKYCRRKEMCGGGDRRGSGSMLHPVYSPREADLLAVLAFGPYYFG